MITHSTTAGLLLAPLALLAATPLAAAAPRPASPLIGTWINPAHSVTVRIAPCRGQSLCGRVIAASAGAQAKAAAAGTPNLVGSELMSDLAPNGPRVWQGQFFVPDRNIRADGTLTLVAPRALEIEGCALAGLLCKTQRWTKVAEPVRIRRRR